MNKMKMIKLKLMFVFVVFFTSCGFKAINQKTSDLVYLQEINVTGERRAAYILKNDLLLISNKNSLNRYDVEIKIEKQKKDKIKDKSGKVKRHALSISANLKLINLNNKKVVKKTFLRKLDFNVVIIHSDTINNENRAVENITETLSEDIISFIVLNLRN